MAVTCTSDNLATLSACFSGMSPIQMEAVKIYLLAVQAGVDPDAAALAEAAKCLFGLSPAQQKAIQVYLLCQIANAGGAGGGGDLDFGPTPQTINGSMQLRDMLDAIDTANSVTELNFKTIETVTGDIINSGGTLESLVYENLVSVGGQIQVINATGLASFSAPLLATVGTDMLLSGNSALTTLSFPSLISVGGTFDITNDFGLVSLSLPLLQTVGLMQTPGCNALATVDLSSLVTCTDSLNFGTSIISSLSLVSLQSVTTNLNFAGNVFTTFSVPVLTTVGGDLLLNSAASLTSFSAPNWLPTDGTTIDFTDCALDATSVNFILARCVAASVTTCTINLSGGTNAAPTGQGIVDSAALTLAGNTVTTN